MKTEDLKKFAEQLNKSKVEGKGYVLLPSLNGFDFIEVDEVSLKLFLRQKLEQDTKIARQQIKNSEILTLKEVFGKLK